MTESADELLRTVAATLPRLRALHPLEVCERPAPGKWCVQEILGHLIDSAANNHQRFVRAQAEDPLVFPKYDQEHWVTAQAYNDRPWLEIVELWQYYNRHLAHVIWHLPEDRLGAICRIGDCEPMTLAALVEDYLTHLKHHLAQIDALAGKAKVRDGQSE